MFIPLLLAGLLASSDSLAERSDSDGPPELVIGTTNEDRRADELQRSMMDALAAQPPTDLLDYLACSVIHDEAADRTYLAEILRQEPSEDPKALGSKLVSANRLHYRNSEDLQSQKKLIEDLSARLPKGKPGETRYVVVQPHILFAFPEGFTNAQFNAFTGWDIQVADTLVGAALLDTTEPFCSFLCGKNALESLIAGRGRQGTLSRDEMETIVGLQTVSVDKRRQDYRSMVDFNIDNRDPNYALSYLLGLVAGASNHKRISIPPDFFPNVSARVSLPVDIAPRSRVISSPPAERSRDVRWLGEPAAIAVENPTVTQPVPSFVELRPPTERDGQTWHQLAAGHIPNGIGIGQMLFAQDGVRAYIKEVWQATRGGTVYALVRSESYPGKYSWAVFEKLRDWEDRYGYTAIHHWQLDPNQPTSRKTQIWAASRRFLRRAWLYNPVRIQYYALRNDLKYWIKDRRYRREIRKINRQEAKNQRDWERGGDNCGGYMEHYRSW